MTENQQFKKFLLNRLNNQKPTRKTSTWLGVGNVVSNPALD